jgi:hypothetical protein
MRLQHFSLGCQRQSLLDDCCTQKFLLVKLAYVTSGPLSDSVVILPFEPRQTSPTTVNNIERTHIRTHKRFTNIHPTKTPSPRRFTLRAALLKKRDSAPRVHQAGSRSITISQSIPTHHYFVSTIYRHIIISYPHKCNNEVL